MALIEINRRCDECEKTRAALTALQSRVDRFELDYQNLYEKVRTNLAKLAKRARIDQEPQTEPEDTPVKAYRDLVLSKRLGRRGA